MGEGLFPDGPIQGGHDKNNDDLFGETKPGMQGSYDEYQNTDQGTLARDNSTYFGGDSGFRWDTQSRSGVDSATQAGRDYRQQGWQSDQRGPVQLQYGAANQSLGQATNAIDQAGYDRAAAGQARNQQMDALSLQADAARGNAPSRAEILGRGLIDQSLKSQAAGAAGARGGPLAQMAAQRNVQNQTAGFQSQGMNQLSALRADEMERARQGYQAGASGIRGQDYQGAQSAVNQGLAYGQIGTQQAGMARDQGAMDMDQRRLNQADRQFYETKAWDTQNQQADRNLRDQMNRREMSMERWKTQGGWNRDSRHKETASVYSAIGNALGMFAGISDARAKQPASLGKEPPLLLAGGKQSKTASPNWLDMYMDKEKANNAERTRQDEHERRMKDAEPSEPENPPAWLKASEAPDLLGGREDPYTKGTPGGIQREDPYGSGEVYFGRSPGNVDYDPSMTPAQAPAQASPASSFQSKWGDSAGMAGADSGSGGGGMEGAASAAAGLMGGGSPSVGGALSGTFGQMAQIYGSDVTMKAPMRYSSDAEAKRAAFQEGVIYGGLTQIRGEAPTDSLPDYMNTSNRQMKSFTRVNTPEAQRTKKVNAKEGEGMWNDYVQMMATPGLGGIGVTYGLAGGAAGGVKDALAKDESRTYSSEDPNALPMSLLESRTPSEPVSSKKEALISKPPMTMSKDKTRRHRSQEAATQSPVPAEKGGSETARGLEMWSRPLNMTDEKSELLDTYRSDKGTKSGMPMMSEEAEADANRKLQGSAWTYKPEYAPPGEQPGQLHYGGMAQNFEKNPITKTAVRENPKTGLKEIDIPSMMQVQGAGIASLQRQVDALKGGRRRG